MNNTDSHTRAEARSQIGHRYEIFREAKDGSYVSNGSQIDSAERAVEAFLRTPPLYEGGATRLWDHHQQQAVAISATSVSITHLGCKLHTRATGFFDQTIGELARRVIEREAYSQSLGERIDSSN